MAWNNVLCMYYSRTGHTKRAMEEIARALNAELAEIQDGVDRGGTKGWLRSGSVGYDFWQEEFLRQTQEFLKEGRWQPEK